MTAMLWSAPQLAIVLTIVVFVIYKSRDVFVALRSPLSKIPGPSYAAWTTMHLRYGFATGMVWKMVEAAHDDFGPIVRLGPRQVWIAEKEALKQILSTIDLPKVAMYAEISRDRFNPGLFGEIRHDQHKSLKRFLSPAFTVSYVDNLEKIFGQSVHDLLRKYRTALQDNVPAVECDLMEDLHNVALDIMGECSFGKGFGQTNPDKEAEEGVEERVWRSIPRAIFDGLAKRYQNVFFKRFFRAIGMNVEYDWPAQMIIAIDRVVQRRKKRQEGTRPDLLQHMIEEGKNPSSNTRMDTRQIVDQMAEIMLAGSETTSGTIAALFLELARNPDVKAKLLKSLQVRGVDDPIITSKEIRNSPEFRYLNACIKENLRLHPIASEMGRRTGKQWVKLMGYDLPPHTVVSASYRHVHCDQKYWKEPMRFWPERWLEEDERDGAPKPDMDAYYPFSAGKHSCIGINFAWAEMRTIAANVLTRFDLNEVPGQVVDFRQFITMQFKDGTWKVMVEPRS